MRQEQEQEEQIAGRDAFKERLLTSLFGEKVTTQPLPPDKRMDGRRIVGKGAYAKAQSRRAGLVLSGSFAVFAGALAGFLALACVGFMIAALISYAQAYDQQLLIHACVYLVGALVFGMGMTESLRSGFASLHKAAKNEVVPLTRANAAHLPAPESLVRASQEPAQAQKDVLLRAATQTQDTRKEQLLRASAGEQSGR